MKRTITNSESERILMEVQRLKDGLKNNKIVIVTFLLWILVTESFFGNGSKEWDFAIAQPTVLLKVGNVTEDDKKVISLNKQELQQDIEINSMVFSGISLYMDTLNQQISGKLELELVDKENGRLIKKWTNNLGDLKIKGFYDFMLSKPIEVKEKMQYTLKIKAINESKVVPQLTLVSNDELFSSELRVNGEKNTRIVPYRILGNNSGVLIYFLYAMYAGMTLSLFIMCIMLLKKKRIELIFSVSVFVIGMIYLFVIPPFVVPDEPAHFINAYAQSSRLLGKEVVDDSGKVLVASDALWGQDKNVARRDVYIQFMKGALGKGTANSGDAIATIETSLQFNPGYIPQIIGISLARIFRMNSEQLLLLGRLFALLWYCFIMFWAIKFIPFGKAALFIIGMLPMTMQQVVSYSYDSVLFGVCFFCISFILYIAYRKEKIKWYDIVIVLLITVTISLIKLVYLPILGLAIMIPQIKFGGMRKKSIASVLVVATSIFTIVITKLSLFASWMSSFDISTAEVEGSTISLSFCIKHPQEISRLLWRTVERDGSRLVSEMLGSSLGWLDLNIPQILVIFMVIVILLSILRREGEEQYITTGIRLWGGTLTIVIIVAVMISLLLLWTLEGASLISGLQGRYFLPILPLLVILLRNNVIVTKKNIDKYLILSIGYINCMVIYFILLITVSR